MLIVSDTSPINYLVLIKEIEILPILFEQIYIPQRVAEELQNAKAPEAVRVWIAARPQWLQIRSPTNQKTDLKLDPGEVEAISLAHELKAEHLLIDEWAGRKAARDEGLHVIGTLGVLVQASAAGLLTLKSALESLGRTSFRIDTATITELLDEEFRRKRGG